MTSGVDDAAPAYRSRPGAAAMLPAVPGQVAEIVPGIWCSPGLSNVYLLPTTAGRVIINAGMGFEGPVHRANLDSVDAAAVRYLIVTQGHYDHVGGLDSVRDPDTEVVAQANWQQWRDDNERLARYRAARSAFAFSDTLAAGIARIQEKFGRISDNEAISGIIGSPTDHHAAPFSLTEEFVSVYRMHPLIPDDWNFFSLESGEHLVKADFTDLQGVHTRGFMDKIQMGDMWYSFGLASAGAVCLHNYPNALRNLTRVDGQVTDDVVILNEVTYEVSLREALTGAEVAATTVVANDGECPMYVTFTEGESSVEHDSFDDEAIQAFVEPYVLH